MAELWEQLENEPDAAFDAFRHYYMLPRKDRTMIGAWRSYSGNTTATQPASSFKAWAADFAWQERAKARDGHLDRVYLKGEEKEIEKHAAQMRKASEEVRGRMHEMLTLGYNGVIEYFENLNWTTLRPQDAIQIIKLHLEAAKEFPADDGPVGDGEDWTEDDDREIREAMEAVWAEAAENAAQKPPERDQEEGS